MSAPRPWDPCLDARSSARPCRRPADPGRRGPRDRHERRRAGAPLRARHADRPRPATTSRSSRCRRAAPCASSSAPASPVLVIDEPDDAIAVGALAAHLAEVRADVVHAHMYRAETVGTRAPSSRSARPASAGRTSSPRSTRAGSAPRRTGDALLELTPDVRPADRGLEGDRARRSIDEGRAMRPDRPHLQRRRPPALRPPGAVLHAPRGVRDGARLADRRASSPGSSRRRATRRCSRRGRRVLRAVPDAYLLIVGEGSRRDALEAPGRASCGSPTGSSSPAGATTSRRSPPRSTSPSCRPTARRRA